MEIRKTENLDPFEEDIQSVETDKKRSKTSLRMHYEAQVEVIKRQLGDLEHIRSDLGLSQRKMCQLLMVDPSAWTRWTKGKESPPPHIWRALQWYLILQEKIPGLTPQYFAVENPKTLQIQTLQKIEAATKRIADLEEELHRRKDQLVQLEEKKKLKVTAMKVKYLVWVLMGGILLALLLYIIVR